MTLKHWIHHLLNPHCEACQLAEQDKAVCESCETLKTQLAIANNEKRQMLETIISFSKPAEVIEVERPKREEVQPKAMTWNVRRQLLEAEDRKKAQVMAEQRKIQIDVKQTEAISKLEEELGIKDEVIQ